MKYAIVILTFSALLFYSCKKDKENPVITVNKPVEHSSFMTGETVEIQATFSDDRELASFSFMVGNEAGEHLDDIHMDAEGIIAGPSYTFSTSLPIPDSMSAEMFYLHFTVKDADGKETRKKHMLHTH